jgi:hypothetical protein
MTFAMAAASLRKGSRMATLCCMEIFFTIVIEQGAASLQLAPICRRALRAAMTVRQLDQDQRPV